MAVTRYVFGEVLPQKCRAVALGVFDGLHIGHRAVISKTCGVIGADGAMLTSTVLSLTGVPKTDSARLLTLACEDQLLETLGADEWIDLPFTMVADLSPEAFVREILHEHLQAEVVSCGYNYRFGKGAVGTAETLRRLCEPLGITVCIADAVERDGGTVSSTRIRKALQSGDVQEAMALFGRPFSVDFPVTRGDHRGSSWGVPTVNQVFPADYTVPRHGVYASLVTVGDREYRAVTNIGVHPTVGGVNRPQAETFLEDFEGDLYGQSVQVFLIRFLRDEQCFESVEALRTQIVADIRQAHDVLSGADGARAVIFDFDDTLQDRVSAFLDVARCLLKRHMSAQDADAREAYAGQMLVENNGGYVNYQTFFHNLVAAWPFDEGVTGEQVKWEYRRLFPLYSRLFEETVDVLKTLRQRGYRLGVITNGSSLMQNRKIDVTALRPYLDLVLVSDDEGVCKPNPELFRRAADRLCAAPENCVFVGDHPINDIQGARSAGMQAIFVNTRDLPDRTEGVPTVGRLADILNYLTT